MSNMFMTVDTLDGVDQKEALYIATNYLKNRKEAKYFLVKSVDIETGAKAEKYPNIWFVFFLPKDQADETSYYSVMIVKETGQILSAQVRSIQ